MKTTEGSPASEASAADAAPAIHDDASPDRPSTEGPPRAQTRAMRTGGTAGRPITVATDEDSDDEDSDEKLEDSQDEGSQGTAETIALLELGVGGQQYYDWERHCLVRLGQKLVVELYFVDTLRMSAKGLSMLLCAWPPFVGVNPGTIIPPQILTVLLSTLLRIHW
jgi:hypothetical protein